MYKPVQFMYSVGKELVEGVPITEQTIAARLATCEACPYWKPATGLVKVISTNGKMCTKCGCSDLKLKLSTSKCPLGKWPAAV